MLYLVRHGETSLNKNHQLRGWANPPLDDDGREAAHETADKIEADKDFGEKKPVLVVASDLTRAAQTGKIIAGRVGGMFATAKELRPWNIGELSGMDSKKGERILGQLKAEGKAPKGGETYEAFARRWESALKQLKSVAKNRHLIVVTHFRNVKHATGLTVDPCCFVKLPK